MKIFQSPMVRLLGAGCLLLALAACEEGNPIGNSVITAHGNTDWHIDTAEEFLYGTEMDGTASAANHVPDTWVKRHMHVGGSNMNSFYYDADEIGSGQDTDTTDGIDRAMLFFYAGHGAPTLWNTLGNNASQGNMLLGNYSEINPGLLRYYWQCSCDVFAHGPHDCPAGSGTDFEYSCPQEFDGSADSFAMRNVYERWGPALGPNLRMACGASTAAYCHESETNRIWDNYNNKSYDVADSFIYGLHRSTGNRANVVPLCITRGNLSTTATPLFDQTFTPQPNPVGDGDYLHLQFLSNFRDNAPDFVFEIPERLPVYRLIPLPIPDPYANLQFEKLENLLVSAEEIDGRGARIRISTLSGAVSVLGERKPEVTADPLKETDYVEAATAYLRQQGLYESSVAEPFGNAMNIQTQGPDGELQDWQKHVRVMYKRIVPVAGSNAVIPVLGAGGVLEVQLNNDGTVFAASKIWRELGEVVQQLPVKPFDQALAEAREQAGDLQNYKLGNWQFGYKERAGNVAQETLEVVYEFNFQPLSEDARLEYPPQIVEVDGFIRG
ncbi:MAG: hypothetical protein CML06_08580 [Pseudomonadales bacterium]|nr:hypothetical protein [Pseudomonadales bacterium]